jgi:hypothetical protein
MAAISLQSIVSASRRAERLIRETDLARLRGMFLEVPGTRLSVAQAARLAGVEPLECRQILETLADLDFLKVGRDGTFTVR